MNLSARQWVEIAIADIFIRAVLLFVLSFNPLVVILSFLLSALHLMFLISVGSYLGTFEIRRRAAVFSTLLATNVLFVTVTVSVWVAFIWTGQRTFCSVSAAEFYNSDYRCVWVKGSIKWAGVQTIALTMAIHVVVNVMVVVIMLAPDWLRRYGATRRHPSLGQDSF